MLGELLELASVQVGDRQCMVLWCIRQGIPYISLLYCKCCWPLLPFFCWGEGRGLEDTEWPAMSPGVTSLKYFLLSYKKTKLPENSPHTIKELRNHITEDTRAGDDSLQVVMQNSDKNYENVWTRAVESLHKTSDSDSDSSIFKTPTLTPS
jgi:hypothetical protein